MSEREREKERERVVTDFQQFTALNRDTGPVIYSGERKREREREREREIICL